MTIDTLESDDSDGYLEQQTFKSGESIALEPDSCWLVKQGIVKASTRTESGKSITFGYWSENDLLGTPLSAAYLYQVKCLTTVVAHKIPLDRTSKFIDEIQAQIRQTEEILYILHAEKADRRLRQILIWLSHKFGCDIAAGRLIQLRLTHQDLAELIGATRVTITKLVNKLEQEGFLSRPRRNRIVIR